jgi:cysteine-rich repeat protein
MTTRSYALALSLLLASCKEGNNTPPPEQPDPAVCGDGVVGLGEPCDDGNQIDDDACRNSCNIPFCGDGIVDANETCDDGNFNSSDACTNACQNNTCGNGASDDGELCYDRQPAIPAGVFPFGIKAADMNGDQLDDLVVTLVGGPGVAVFLGDGQGGFAAPLTATTNDSPFGLITADFDGDGDLDVATGNNTFDNAGNINGSSVSTLLNDGAGQLIAQGNALPTQGVLALTITAGDINSDGSQDVALVGLNNAKISFLFNNGAGVFTETAIDSPPQFFIGVNPIEVLAVDLDSDGDDDVVLGDGLSPHLVLFRNNDGVLDDEPSIPLGFGRGHLAAGDLNGDSTIDLATTTLGGSSVVIAFNDGGASFSQTSSGIVNGPSGVVIADVNNDGLGDIITSDGGDLFGDDPGNTTSIFLQEDDGNINLSARFEVDTGPSGIASADFNQDGVPDIAVCSIPTGSITLLLSGQ